MHKRRRQQFESELSSNDEIVLMKAEKVFIFVNRPFKHLIHSRPLTSDFTNCCMRLFPTCVNNAYKLRPLKEADAIEPASYKCKIACVDTKGAATAENQTQQPYAHWTLTRSTNTTELRLALFKRWITSLRSHWLALHKSTALSTGLSVWKAYLWDEVWIQASDWSGGNADLADLQSGRFEAKSLSVPKVDWWADGEQKSSSLSLSLCSPGELPHPPKTCKQKIKKPDGCRILCLFCCFF